MIVVISNIRTTTVINTITNTILAKLVIEPRYHLLDQQHHYQICQHFPSKQPSDYHQPQGREGEGAESCARALLERRGPWTGGRVFALDGGGYGDGVLAVLLKQMGIFVLDGVDDVLLGQVGKYLFLVVVIMASLHRHLLFMGTVMLLFD